MRWAARLGLPKIPVPGSTGGQETQETQRPSPVDSYLLPTTHTQELSAEATGPASLLHPTAWQLALRRRKSRCQPEAKAPEGKAKDRQALAWETEDKGHVPSLLPPGKAGDTEGHNSGHRLAVVWMPLGVLDPH